VSVSASMGNFCGRRGLPRYDSFSYFIDCRLNAAYVTRLQRLRNELAHAHLSHHRYDAQSKTHLENATCLPSSRSPEAIFKYRNRLDIDAFMEALGTFLFAQGSFFAKKVGNSSRFSMRLFVVLFGVLSLTGCASKIAILGRTPTSILIRFEDNLDGTKEQHVFDLAQRFCAESGKDAELMARAIVAPYIRDYNFRCL